MSKRTARFFLCAVPAVCIGVAGVFSAEVTMGLLAAMFFFGFSWEITK